MNRTTRLKELLYSSDLEFVCEAHNGLSAKIVEEAGFPAVWASGFTIASQLGVRDNNEASWTQVLDVIEFMADATSLPILMDGDTGFGNFNNVQRLVRKLEQRSVAGVCLEDKLFPKTNSFVEGNRQQLAPIDEFSGKIKAAKDAQTDPEFSVISRIEAFIAGWGLSEALRRAEAYHAAGADAILIHSALSEPNEILEFKREWGDRCPVVIVPTRYYATPTSVFSEYGFSLVIWANHLLRAATASMSRVANRIRQEAAVTRIEDEISSMAEIFRLQGVSRLLEAERLYLPPANAMPTAVILAAGRGAELEELTLDRPKTMVEVGGVPILERIVAAYNAAGVRDIIVVRGYQKEAVDVLGITPVDNDEFETTGELASLRAGLSGCSGERGIIVSYGDVLFRRQVIDILDEMKDEPLVVTVDSLWQESWNRDRLADYVHCSRPYSRNLFEAPVFLERIDPALPHDEIDGEWMGFLKIDPDVLPEVLETIDSLLADPVNQMAGVPRLLEELIARGRRVRALYTSGSWCDIDSVDDVIKAGGF